MSQITEFCWVCSPSTTVLFAGAVFLKNLRIKYSSTKKTNQKKANKQKNKPNHHQQKKQPNRTMTATKNNIEINLKRKENTALSLGLFLNNWQML